MMDIPMQIKKPKSKIQELNSKVKSFAFLLVFFTFAFLFLSLSKTLASVFASAYIRLDSQSANTLLSGTVCADPSSAGAGTESKVLVTFPSDFTISQTASNWTTSTSDLPQGATAWPGIGAAATSVTGKTVTFASSDLTTSSLYCFNFIGNSSTTGSAGNDKAGTIATTDSSNATIDSTTYAASIVSNSQINITASVDPPVSDLPIAIESVTAGTTFPQNTTISYKITYGSNTVAAIPLTIQAQWSQGTISGNPSPSVDILDYVVGSASNAYSSTPPVVDTINRTITWTIASFPGTTTGQTVTFSLKTNSNYTGGSLVSFSVSARAVSGSTVTPDKTVTQNYQYSGVSAAPSPTPAPSASVTPTPTPTPSALVFKNISINSISKSEVNISVTTNNKTNLTIFYGTSLNNLSKNIKTLIFATESVFTLPDLKPDTDYYFKIIAKDENGKTATSDIFTFKTAKISEIPLVSLQSLIATSNNVVLLNPQAQAITGQGPLKYIIVVPTSTVFEIHFGLEKRTLVKTIQTIIKNKNVLGVNTFDQRQANSNFVQLVETRPGIYTGRLLSRPDPGNYELYAKITDYYGNLTLQKIAEIRVVNQFVVLEKGTKNPIEGARIFLYLYNPTTKIYEVISPQILPIDNPTLSSLNGSADIVLPPGKYRAEISAIFYKSATAEFEIGFESGNYPVVYLEKEPFNIINILTYYRNVFGDSLNDAANYVRVRTQSQRLFDLITTGTLFIFIITTVFAFSAKTHIPFFYLPYFLIYKTNILFKRENSSIFLGKVVEDTTQNPVSRVIVNLIDSKNNIIASLKTNKLGEFYYPHVNLGDYKISVSKKGFKDIPPFIYKKENKMIPLIIPIAENESELEKRADALLIYIVDSVGLFFEFMLFLGIIIEIFFIFTFGFLRIAPFMAITVINLLLLFLFLYKPRNLTPVSYKNATLQ